MTNAEQAQQKAYLRRVIDCRQLAERYGLTRTSHRDGKWVLYKRPGGEQHPSFGVAQDGFHDFAHDEHGDVFALIMKLEHCDFKTAFQKAVEYAGGSTVLATWSHLPAPSAPPPAQPWTTPTWQTHARALQQECELHAPYALAYCAQRGLFPETVYAFRLGYAEHQKGLPNGVTIPTFDATGQLVAIKVRDLSPDPARKYGQLAGSRQGTLFGLPFINPVLPFCLVEGEFDVILGHQEASEYVNFVTLGSSSLALNTEALEALTGASVVYLLPDRDEAGEKAAGRWAEALDRAEIPWKRLEFPEGVKDLTEYHQRGGNVNAWFHALTARYLPHGVRMAAVACKFAVQAEAYERILALQAKGLLPVGEPLTVPDVIAAEAADGVPTDTKNSWYRVYEYTVNDPVMFSLLDADSSKQYSLTRSGNVPGPVPRYFTLRPIHEIRELLRLRFPYRNLEHEIRYNTTFLPSPKAMQQVVGGDLWVALADLIGDGNASRALDAMANAWPKLKRLAAAEAEQAGTPLRMTGKIQQVIDREQEMLAWLMDDTRLDLEPDYPYAQAMLRAEVRAGFLAERASTNHELALFCGLAPTGFAKMKDAAGVLVTREKRSTLVPISAQRAQEGEQNAMTIRPEGRVTACDAVGEYGERIAYAPGPQALSLPHLAGWERAGVAKVRIHTEVSAPPVISAAVIRPKRVSSKAGKRTVTRETREPSAGFTGVGLSASAAGLWLKRAADLAHVLAGAPKAKTWEARIEALEQV